MNNSFYALSRLLEAGDDHLYDAPTIKSELPNFEMLAQHGILTSLSRDEHAAACRHGARYEYIRCPCGSGHSAQVKKTFNGPDAEWHAICEDGSLLPLPPADVPIWKLSLEGLAKFVGCQFKCACKQPQRLASGIYMLGKSNLYIARETWDILFAGKLTDEIADNFQEFQKKSILITGITPGYIPAKLEKQVFPMCKIFQCNDGRQIVVDRTTMATSLNLVLKAQAQSSCGEISHVHLRISRLTKIVHDFLLCSCDHYNGREEDGCCRQKILPAKKKQEICAEYCAKYKDDDKWGRTFLSKLSQHGAIGCTLEALIVNQSRPDFVKRYREWYENPRNVSLPCKREAPEPEHEDIADALNRTEDSDTYTEDPSRYIISDLAIGTDNAYGHITKSV